MIDAAAAYEIFTKARLRLSYETFIDESAASAAMPQ